MTLPKIEDLVLDMETNGLIREVTEIHCFVLRDIHTDRAWKYHNYLEIPSDGTLEEGVEVLNAAKTVIGHNLAGFDLLVLLEMLGFDYGNKLIIDTMLLGNILFPEYKDCSLEDWGLRLKMKELKVQIPDWTKLTPDILRRCVSDTKMNLDLYLYLLEKGQELLEKDGKLSLADPLKLECDVAKVHGMQVKTGVAYNIPLAEKYHKEWMRELDELEAEILEEAPKFYKKYGTVVTKLRLLPSKKRGELGLPGEFTKQVKDWFNTEDNTKILGGGLFVKQKHPIESVKGDFTRIEPVPVNIRSSKQMKAFMLYLGWVPTEWNYKKDKRNKPIYDPVTREKIKTSPKLTEDSYDSLPEGLGQKVARYNKIKSRVGLIINFSDENGGSLPLARKSIMEPGVGNVPAEAFTCGTPTARYRHVKPIANLPDVEQLYGKEYRSLYGPHPGQYQVGVDLAGIENHVMCEFCLPYDGGKEFAEIVLEGDWHTHNANTWGVSRKVAKTILYAMMYTAQAITLGFRAGATSVAEAKIVGERIKKGFEEANPALTSLVRDLTEACESNGGYLVGLDGRPFFVRAIKDVLNTYIQGNSAIIFKKWMIKCQEIEDVKLGYAKQMIAYHDELQFTYPVIDYDFHPETFAHKVVEAAGQVGKDLGFTIPIDADYKVGINYARCH